MIPQRAIEKAIKGGWYEGVNIEWEDESVWIVTSEGGAILSFPAIALDPEFWRALGKALGWDNLRHNGGTGDYPFNRFYYWRWQGEAHKFYHIILTGADTKAFWDELLTPIEE